MSTIHAIFLDDGGVINDNQVRAPQWQQMVAEFFAPRLGGAPEAWAEANRTIFEGLLGPAAWNARLQAAADYAAFDYAYQRDWLAGMCTLVGVSAPPPAEAVALAREASAAIIPRVRSAFPGAADAIRTLHARGYALHTASGEPSYDLAMYLNGMGVRACFGRLYGPDLLDIFKIGPAFYTAMFADLGRAPATALVLDDSPRAVAWAAAAGARAVLVQAAPPAPSAPPLHITRLAELPALLDRIG